jgi:hypothetical protein
MVKANLQANSKRQNQTMNTYAHVMPHIQAEAIGRFSKRFSQG